jgi:TRAP-type C4-dicarboxylate transport system permease small subunit
MGLPFPFLEGWMQKILWIVRADFERWVAKFCVTMMTFSVLGQLFSRLLGHPIAWGEETARYFYIWFCFIAAAYMTRVRGHIRVAYFLNLLPERTQKIIEIIQIVMVIICTIWILPSAVAYAIDVYQRRSPALEIPMFYVYVSFPIGMVLLIIRSIGVIAEDIRSLRQPKSAGKSCSS